MSIPNWPAELPRPERRTWQAQDQDARKARQSENGPPGWGLKFSNAARLVSLSVLLTRDQSARFENFYRYETRQGSLPFWMPDPSTDGWPLYGSDGLPLLIAGGEDDGEPILLSATWLCTFGQGTPVETVEGVHFRKTFSVAVLP